MQTDIGHLPSMVKRPKVEDRIYLGEWIAFRGKIPADIERATGLTNGYLSLLISGEKDNPSLLTLSKLAKAIGVPVGLLFTPPEHLSAPVRINRSEVAALASIAHKARNPRK